MTVSSIKVKVVRKPTLKIKTLVKFPANVLSSNFLTITKANGTYTFGVDYTLLGPGPISNPTTAIIAILDQTAGVYKEVSLSSLLTSGLDADLQAIAALTTTGILARTASNTWALRTVTGTTNEITVTNGDGVAGAPTLSLPAALTFTGKTITGGTYTGVVSFNGNIWTAGTGTLTLGAGKTATISNTLTFTGTDSSSVAFGAGGTVLYNGGALGTPSSATLTNATGLPLSGHTTQGAYTIVANATGSTAVPTAMDVTALTSKPSPISADIVLIQDSAASFAFKKTTVGALASAGSVASYNTRTGAVTATGTDVPLRSYLAGLTLSTAGGSASFSVAAGVATDSTNVSMMALASSLTKSTSAWSVGAGGALDTGVIGNQWYHVYEIQRPDTGVVDVCFSASASAPTFGSNIPAAYTLYRRIGSIFKASSVWTQFTQLGDEFIWTSPVQDQNLVGTLGTTAQTLSLASVPSGFQVLARIRINAYHNTLIAATLLSSLDEQDNAPGVPGGNYNVVSFVGGTASGVEMMTRTNTSGQVRARSTQASTNLQIVTVGWTDRRGRDS